MQTPVRLVTPPILRVEQSGNTERKEVGRKYKNAKRIHQGSNLNREGTTKHDMYVSGHYIRRLKGVVGSVTALSHATGGQDERQRKQGEKMKTMQLVRHCTG